MCPSIGLSLSLGSPLDPNVIMPEAPQGAAPVLNAGSFSDQAGSWAVTTDHPGQGSYHWARIAAGAAAPGPDGAGGWDGSVEESGSLPVPAPAMPVDIPETGVSGQAYQLCLYQRSVDGQDSAVLTLDYTADSTAPVLSNVVAYPLDGAAGLCWASDGPGGIGHWVITASATAPSGDQIRAGQDHTGAEAVDFGQQTVTSAGSQGDINAAGLTNDTGFHFHIVQSDLRGNLSPVHSAGVTPFAGALPPSDALDRILSQTVISSTATQSGFDSTAHGSGAVTIPHGGNRIALLFVAALAHNGASPTPANSATLGGQAMTSLGSFDTVNSAMEIFQLLEADLPAGAASVVLDLGGNGARAVLAHLLVYENCDQVAPTGPLFSEFGQDARVTLGTDRARMLSFFATRASGITQVPFTVDAGELLLSAETGTANFNDVAAAISDQAPGAPGEYTHNFTAAGGAQSPWTMALELRQI